MSAINIHQAKTHLSKLLERVSQGEEVVIARNGEPIARLVPVEPTPRRPGRLKGRIHISPDFDAPLPDEIADAFRGEKD